ncbi:MAG: hypothetical protein Q9160_006069 [Pyrenula sp. 1 TL-2023]
MAVNNHPQPPAPAAQAAQIPLQNFTLPAFPPEASTLRSLTLTSDINLTEYQSLVSSPNPPLSSTGGLPPQSITELILELFSLGFPSSFLSTLASALPNLKSLTIFSSLIDGLNDASRRDAEDFFRTLLRNGLRELHLLDTFTRPGLYGVLANAALAAGSDATGGGGLRFLEISYTDRCASDEAFHSRIPADELAALAGVPGLVALSLTLNPPPPSNADADGAEADAPVDGLVEIDGEVEKIKPLPASSEGATKALVDVLSKPQQGQQLKMLDLTLFALTPTQVGEILRVNEELAVLSIAVQADSVGRLAEREVGGLISEELGKHAKCLEVLEEVDIPPSGSKIKRYSPSSLNLLNPIIEDQGAKCTTLQSYKITMAKARKLGIVNFGKQGDGKWMGEVLL